MELLYIIYFLYGHFITKWHLLVQSLVSAFSRRHLEFDKQKTSFGMPLFDQKSKF